MRLFCLSLILIAGIVSQLSFTAGTQKRDLDHEFEAYKKETEAPLEDVVTTLKEELKKIESVIDFKGLYEKMTKVSAGDPTSWTGRIVKKLKALKEKFKSSNTKSTENDHDNEINVEEVKERKIKKYKKKVKPGDKHKYDDFDHKEIPKKDPGKVELLWKRKNYYKSAKKMFDEQDARFEKKKDLNVLDFEQIINEGVVIEDNLQVRNRPQVVKLRGFYGFSHKVRSGGVAVMDENTIQIDDFNYNGKGDAHFLVGKDTRCNSQFPHKDQGLFGVTIPDEKGSCEKLGRYKHRTITLKLPGNMTWCEVNYLSVFSREDMENYGYITLPEFRNYIRLFPYNEYDDQIEMCKSYLPRWWTETGHNVGHGHCRFNDDNDEKTSSTEFNNNI